MRDHILRYDDYLAPSCFMAWQVRKEIDDVRLRTSIDDQHGDLFHFSMDSHDDALREFETHIYRCVSEIENIREHLHAYVDLEEVENGAGQYVFTVVGPLHESAQTWLNYCKSILRHLHPAYEQECVDMIILPRLVIGFEEVPQPVELDQYLPYLRSIDQGESFKFFKPTRG